VGKTENSSGEPTKKDGTARSVEDETRNGHRNANRNPNRNLETIVLGLFSFENLKRDVEW